MKLKKLEVTNLSISCSNFRRFRIVDKEVILLKTFDLWKGTILIGKSIGAKANKVIESRRETT
jgi:hypothetical protein